jgi:nucleotide-binding universal stress UspA family protein
LWPERETSGPVVVGVDGSRAALNAVRWAAAEAVHRDVPLRIVHAVRPRTQAGPVALGGHEESVCDTVLLEAEAAATQAHGCIRVELARIIGAPGDALVYESHRAMMICVGSRPPQNPEGRLVGPTATALAERACSPVAIIRTRDDGTPRTEGVVSVVLSDEADNDDVVHLAMQEGRLRRATVRQIDRRTDSWIRRFPDVHVETVAAGTGGQYCDYKNGDAAVGLAVVGRADADQIASLTVPNCHPILGYPDCSVLLVRH